MEKYNKNNYRNDESKSKSIFDEINSHDYPNNFEKRYNQ